MNACHTKSSSAKEASGREATLASLRPGERGVIRRLLVEGLTRRRFLDLGLVPGTEVEAVMESPLKDPVAYFVRGSLLALRREDAERILIRRLPSPFSKGEEEETLSAQEDLP